MQVEILTALSCLVELTRHDPTRERMLPVARPRGPLAAELLLFNDLIKAVTAALDTRM